MLILQIESNMLKTSKKEYLQLHFKSCFHQHTFPILV